MQQGMPVSEDSDIEEEELAAEEEFARDPSLVSYRNLKKSTE